MRGDRARTGVAFSKVLFRQAKLLEDRFRRYASPTIYALQLHKRSHPLRATRRDQAWLQLLASCRRVGSTTSSRDAIGLTVGAEPLVATQGSNATAVPFLAKSASPPSDLRAAALHSADGHEPLGTQV